MKLLRFGDHGEEKWGLADAEGRIRTLDDVLEGVTGVELSQSWLAQLAELDPEKLSILKTGRRIGPPIRRPLNFVCIGMNYADHCEEAGLPVPTEPYVFLKSLSAFSGPFDDIKIPRGGAKTDWEAELGVVIGTEARYVSEAEALNHVAGYCVVNDVSERAFQMERGGSFDKGKSCDSFGPVGPYLVTPDEVPDPQNLDIWCEVDGQRMQNGNTKSMIFSVRTLISYVSQFITLHPGDVIATGTPPGVGLGKKPDPIYLRPGQTVKTGVRGLGEQQAKTVAA